VKFARFYFSKFKVIKLKKKKTNLKKAKETAFKDLTLSDFYDGELIKDDKGNIFATRLATAARVLFTSLPTLRAFHRYNGLLPRFRRINLKQVYRVQDVIDYTPAAKI
jgi:hypothetical protein